MMAAGPTLLLWRALHPVAAVMGSFPVSGWDSASSRPWPAAVAYAVAAFSLATQVSYPVAMMYMSSPTAILDAMAATCLFIVWPLVVVTSRARSRHRVSGVLEQVRRYQAKYPLSQQGWRLALVSTVVILVASTAGCLGALYWYLGQPALHHVPVFFLFPNIVHGFIEYAFLVVPTALLAGLGADLRHRSVTLVTASRKKPVRPETAAALWREVIVRQRFLHDLFVDLGSIQAVNVLVFLLSNSMDLAWSLSDVVVFFNNEAVDRGASFGSMVSVASRCFALLFLCWVLCRRSGEFALLQKNAEMFGITLQHGEMKLQSEVRLLKWNIDHQDPRLNVMGLFYLTSATFLSIYGSAIAYGALFIEGPRVSGQGLD